MLILYVQSYNFIQKLTTYMLLVPQDHIKAFYHLGTPSFSAPSRLWWLLYKQLNCTVNYIKYRAQSSKNQHNPCYWHL